MSLSTCIDCGTRHLVGDVCPTRVLVELTRPVTDPHTSAFASDTVSPDSRFEPGDQLGPYHIERLIGRGGMGEVYEATHGEDGRRVALKVLTRPLRRPLDRERFLVEGRMAAAFTHPNSVYVFETRDVGGIPTIAMELMPGDTLQDVVWRHGPLSPRRAAEAILQVIAGLQAADEAGVLHRDVKPANCLVAGDGTIKIGDFGLSISPGHAGMSPSSFAGTPHFAAPEQLRGDRLDRRADIYAVGATLTYLLTGHPPYEADDLRTLHARIESQTPDLSGHERLPAPLERVIKRCLAPALHGRYQGYAELRADLLPFASRSRPKANGFARVTEGAFELFAVLPLFAFVITLLMAPPNATPGKVGATVAALLGVSFMWSTLKGYRGGRLRDRPPAPSNEWPERDAGQTWTRTLIRVLVFAGPFFYGVGAVKVTGWFPNAPVLVPPLALLGVFALAYVALVRRVGGSSRLLDMLAGKPLDDEPRVSGAVVTAPVVTEQTFGPYQVVKMLGRVDSGELLEAWDPELRRHVWVLKQAAGSPPLSADIRGGLRVSHLKWLQGHHSTRLAWDAFEAPSGQPLIASPHRSGWRDVSVWLLDLASELKARGFDANQGVSLRLERIWISEQGRGMLLDFDAPGANGSDPRDSSGRVPPFKTLQQWLHEVASLGLSPSSCPLPLGASNWLRRVQNNGFASLDDLIRELRLLQTTPERVNRSVRTLSVALSVLCSVLVAIVIGEPLRAVLSGAQMPLPDAVTPLLVAMLVTVVVAVGMSAIGRTGFWLSALRVAIVTRDGNEVSRTRAAFRAALAWSWVPIHLFVVTLGGSEWLVPIMAAACACIGFVTPARGVHDRIAGTYLVPR